MFMKMRIFIPEKWVDKQIVMYRYVQLFQLCAAKEQAVIEISDTIDPNIIDEKIVLVFKAPQSNACKLLAGAAELPPEKTLIVYVADCHDHHQNNTQPVAETSDYGKAMRAMLDRANVVLSPYPHSFKQLWPQYIDKLVPFYHFVVEGHLPEYDEDVFGDRERKVLLAGRVSYTYPLRMWLFKNRKRESISYLHHPGYNYVATNAIIDDRFMAHISKHMGAFATSSHYKYLSAKYLEIPATGTCMFAEQIPELNVIGMVPMIHYIPITKDNVFDVLEWALNDTIFMQKIGHRGRQFVLENFTMQARYNQLMTIVKCAIP